MSKNKILSCKVGWGKTCATHIWKCTWGAKSLLNISCISSQMRIYPKKYPNLNIAMTLITYPRISMESIQIEYPCYRLRMPATKSFSQRCARATLPEVPELIPTASSTNSQGGCDLYLPISKSKYLNVMSIYSWNIHLQTLVCWPLISENHALTIFWCGAHSARQTYMKEHIFLCWCFRTLDR